MGFLDLKKNDDFMDFVVIVVSYFGGMFVLFVILNFFVSFTSFIFVVVSEWDI